jgi:parvulin-like peptidyl-prolyl isomerase
MERDPMKKLALLAAAVVSASASAAPVMLDRVVAQVNGEVITLSEVAERIERVEREMRAEMDADTFREASSSHRSKALAAMIDELLVAQEGARLGVAITDEQIDRTIDNIRQENRVTSDQQFRYLLQAQNFTLEEYREFLRRQILLVETRRKALGGTQVTDEEIRRYYEQNREDFRRPAAVHLRHILVRLSEGASEWEAGAAQQKAQEAARELSAGTSFQDVAMRYSDDPSAAKGGDIGVLAKGQMLPEFEAVAFSLPPGQVSEPVRTKYGLHLVEVLNRTDGNYQPLEEVSGRLREYLQERRVLGKQEEWLSKLREQAFVKVFEQPAVDPAVFGAGRPQPAPAGAAP